MPAFKDGRHPLKKASRGSVCRRTIDSDNSPRYGETSRGNMTIEEGSSQKSQRGERQLSRKLNHLSRSCVHLVRVLASEAGKTPETDRPAAQPRSGRDWHGQDILPDYLDILIIWVGRATSKADADTESLQLLPNLRVGPDRGPQLARNAAMQWKRTMNRKLITLLYTRSRVPYLLPPCARASAGELAYSVL